MTQASQILFPTGISGNAKCFEYPPDNYKAAWPGQRAALTILRMKYPTDIDAAEDETKRDVDKALDEVKIEANSPGEEAVFTLLTSYKFSVYLNNVTLISLELHLKKNILTNGPDREAPYFKAYLSDRNEIYNRQVACSDAIEDMLRHKLSTDLPPCVLARVHPSKEELKTVWD